jgi:hypothetical protein
MKPASKKHSDALVKKQFITKLEKELKRII